MSVLWNLVSLLLFLVIYGVGMWVILRWAWNWMTARSEAWLLRRYGIPNDLIEEWEDDTYGYGR